MSDQRADEDVIAFMQAFSATYLAFHRRTGKRSGLSNSSRAVLTHLSMTGPLTVGEAALHLDRAQSVVSEIVSRLEERGLLERVADPRDRRRTLVWLTDSGRQTLEADQHPLDRDLLAEAMADLTPTERASLISGLRRLSQAPNRKEDG